MNTAELLTTLSDLPLYRVRLTGCSIRGSIVHEHGRRLASAHRDADDCRTVGGYTAVVESYDRHTGETSRTIG